MPTRYDNPTSKPKAVTPFGVVIGLILIRPGLFPLVP